MAAPSVPDGGGEMSFIKLENVGNLDSTNGDFIGNVYSVNDGSLELSRVDMAGIAMPIQTLLFEPKSVNSAFINYGNNQGVDWTPADMPPELDSDYIYAFGMNEQVLSEFAEFIGSELPPNVTAVETAYRIYPKTALSSADITFDAHSAIIDPALYTTADISWFASKGISPAIKNSDGSFTLKSQVKLPNL